MVALFFYAKKGGFSMKNQSYLSVYKCNEFRVVSNEFIGRIEDTPENISAFVVSADFNSNYALVDDMDTVKVFTIGNFLDLVPDTEYLEKELRPVLLQMQFGEIEIPEVRYEAIKKSLEEFLGEKGLSSPISDFLDDKLRSNRQLKTQRGARKFYSDANKQRMEYAKKRSEAIKEYNTLVKEGKIIPKTLIERTLDKAQGHSDNPSVQAARRIAEKRGYDWRTGERLENAKIDNVQIVQLEVYKTGELKGYADFSVEMWDDWKEADEHGEPVATFHGAFLDLFAKEKSQSIDKNLISFNSCTFEINLDSKDNGEGCLKWHNYFLTDIHNKDHFYIIQIVQETGKEEPRFSLEKFEKEEGSKLYLGEWVELEDVIKNSSEIEMVQNKLIELSDKEIGIQNEEIKNIEDDFEELDEVEK